MNITHWMRKEDSGLVRSTLEIAQAEEKLGHKVAVVEPSTDSLQPPVLYGELNGTDVHCIHSQLHPLAYFDDAPKLMWMHGEPLGSVGNKISMRAIVDLATLTQAFICMRREEWAVWNSIKRTHLVPKGVDLDVYKPVEGVEKLSGSPAVLYCENWRGERNPLYLCVAMREVWKRFPAARLHLFNCVDPKMHECFMSLIRHSHWEPFIRTISGPVENVVQLYNQADIVVSCLYPLYARGIESLACGKAFIGPGYREPGYPWTCELSPESIAEAIIKCWENYDTVDYRKWAEERHDVLEMTRRAVEIYERYV